MKMNGSLAVMGLLSGARWNRRCGRSGSCMPRRMGFSPALRAKRALQHVGERIFEMTSRSSLQSDVDALAIVAGGLHFVLRREQHRVALVRRLEALRNQILAANQSSTCEGLVDECSVTAPLEAGGTERVRLLLQLLLLLTHNPNKQTKAATNG